MPLLRRPATPVQTDLEALEEAQNELMLVDDEDAARYLFGECFVHTATDDADSRIETGARCLGPVRLPCARRAWRACFCHGVAKGAVTGRTRNGGQ